MRKNPEPFPSILSEISSVDIGENESLQNQIQATHPQAVLLPLGISCKAFSGELSGFH